MHLFYANSLILKVFIFKKRHEIICKIGKGLSQLLHRPGHKRGCCWHLFKNIFHMYLLSIKVFNIFSFLSHHCENPLHYFLFMLNDEIPFKNMIASFHLRLFKNDVTDLISELLSNHFLIRFWELQVVLNNLLLNPLKIIIMKLFQRVLLYLFFIFFLVL